MTGQTSSPNSGTTALPQFNSLEGKRSMKKSRTPAEMLAALGELNTARGKTYGPYSTIGKVMAAYFPNGITLNTPEEHVRFSLFLFMANKLVRLSTHLPDGVHKDSLDDIAVYAQILQYEEEQL